MILSILTPAIWSRSAQILRLKNEIEDQVNRAMLASNAPSQPVEHLVLLDTRTRSVGLKRQALLDAALGDYIAFLDDDDWPADDYVQRILHAAASHPDVVTFDQRADIDGRTGHIRFHAGATHDEPWQEGETVIRPPWHVCAWRRELVRDCVFPDTSYGEDRSWSIQARREVSTSIHIPAVLHNYRHSAATTAAPPPTA